MLSKIFTNLPELKTERLLLRKLLYSDKVDIYSYAKNPDVAKYSLWEAHQSEMETLEFLNIIYEEYRKNRPAPWGIELKEISRIIGTAGFVKWDRVNSNAEIGYALSKDYWNKGIATEAVKKVIDFGFYNLNLNRIEARCLEFNVPSIKLLEKLGFKFEGILRKQMFVKGKFEDMHLFSLIKTEVNQKKT